MPTIIPFMILKYVYADVFLLLWLCCSSQIGKIIFNTHTQMYIYNYV